MPLRCQSAVRQCLCRLIDEALKLMGDKKQREEMSASISALAMRDSDELIADEIQKILES